MSRTLLDNSPEGELFPLAELPSKLPRGRHGKRMHRSLGFRWAKRGIRNQKLKVVQVGGRLCTTLLWVEEFIKQLTEAKGLRSPSISDAAAEAEAAGQRLAATVFANRRLRKEVKEAT